ncbi:hypothetical protein [Corynebacterium sp. 11A]|uniref:hypothetical protein n=1 Tax=Corynebacterium sp. 11A TaxID=2080510 RepID=UPI00124EBE73|nr:hypothetical protein [Corynebacterium sp. 11A]
MTDVQSLERRVAALELNQRRLMVLLRPGSDDEKAFVRAVLAAGLDATQEVDALNTIRAFVVDDAQRENALGRIRTEAVKQAASTKPRTLTGLVESVMLIVGDVWVAESLVAAVRTQEPQHARWEKLDHEDVMKEWPRV